MGVSIVSLAAAGKALAAEARLESRDASAAGNVDAHPDPDVEVGEVSNEVSTPRGNGKARKASNEGSLQGGNDETRGVSNKDSLQSSSDETRRVSHGGSSEESSGETREVSNKDSQTEDTDVPTLGEVTVRGVAETPIDAARTTIDADTISTFELNDLASALPLAGSATMSLEGGRNERGVLIRGFDLRQVQLFIDGIPVYVPFDGSADLSRFTTFNVAQVSIDTAFSSMLYGPNVMGGAINVVTRRPERPLELSFRAGLFSGKGRLLSGRWGSARGRWYAQAGVSLLSQDYFSVSGSYTGSGVDEDGVRDNTYRRDLAITARAGFRPNATDEYTIGYVRQQGEKGQPPYAGEDPNTKTRYWRWPLWAKDSIYFIGDVATPFGYLKPRVYFDTYRNVLDSYDDNTYSSMEAGYAFTSIYDDYTWGGALEAGTFRLPKNALRAAAHIKLDTHREHNEGEPESSFQDATASLGLEDSLQLLEPLTLVVGGDYEYRKNLLAEDLQDESASYQTPDASSLNGQGGLFLEVARGHTVYSTLGKRSRFPTLKERYSYRLGRALSNPGLLPEQALHAEVGYNVRLREKLTAHLALFRSLVKNTIEQVDDVAYDSSTDTWLYQLQNVGTSVNRGAEGGIEGRLWQGRLTLGGNYQFLDRVNLTSPDLEFVGLPRHRVFAFVALKVLHRLRLVPSVQGVSSSYASSDGLEIDGFWRLNVAGELELPAGIVLKGGVRNVLDADYEISEGYPEEGRSYYASLCFDF